MSPSWSSDLHECQEYWSVYNKRSLRRFWITKRRPVCCDNMTWMALKRWEQKSCCGATVLRWLNRSVGLSEGVRLQLPLLPWRWAVRIEEGRRPRRVKSHLPLGYRRCCRPDDMLRSWQEALFSGVYANWMRAGPKKRQLKPITRFLSLPHPSLDSGFLR
jgi:hypothetical protein